MPAAAWGYFAVNAEGTDLVVWKDDTRTQEWLRFSFPRQRKAPFLCIADFFRPVESGEPDYAAFHVVTMGSRASEREQELFAADRYQEYLLLHGLSVEMTEALAELWHRRIREEWGFADEDGPSIAGLFRQQYRGSRYSWGYPACPDLDDQVKVAELLEIDRIGVGDHRGVPPRARAVDLGDRRPPPRGQVLRRLTPVDNHASQTTRHVGHETHGYPQVCARGGGTHWDHCRDRETTSFVATYVVRREARHSCRRTAR